MRGDRGFILINALVLVLAISAVAAGLLQLAGQGQDRLRAAQLTDQAQLYLDASEMLVTSVLEVDWESDGIDHLGEAWAVPIVATEIGRGLVDLRIYDLQGRLSVNRLEDAEAEDRAIFERLFEELDLPRDLLTAIEAYLAPGGPGAAGYADRAEPIRPRGGPVVLVEELLQVDGMTEDRFSRLTPFVSALPADVPLNANTAPVEVLRAVLPASGEAVAAFVRNRDDRPIADLEDLRARLAPMTSSGADAVTAGMALRSSNFEAVAFAQLEERVLGRRTAFRRDEGDGRTEARIGYSLPDVGAAKPEDGE